MKSKAGAAMTNLKENLFEQPIFMDINISQKRFPQNQKGTNKFLKVLNYNPFKVGLMEFSPNKIELFDEDNSLMVDITPTDILEAKVGILHSLVRSAPMIVPTTRFIFLLEIVTANGSVEVLNDDLSAIDPVTHWLLENKVSIKNPLNLTAELDLKGLDEQRFMEMAKGTEFETPFQLTGSSPRS